MNITSLTWNWLTDWRINSKLIDLCFTRAFDKVNFNDIAYQVRTWDAIIYNYLLNRNIVIPQKERNSKSEKYAGAFVKEPIPGSYEWVVNFDLNFLCIPT